MRDQRRMRILEDDILRMDPALERHDPDLQTTVAILAAAYVTGPDIDRLVGFTGYLRKFITDISRRMHAAGLWENGIAHSEHLMVDNERRKLAVFSDSMVASGECMARRRRDGK